MAKAVAAAKKLTNKVERLENRIENRTAAGKPVGAAEQRLATTQGKLPAATAAVQNRIDTRTAAGKPTGKAEKALAGLPAVSAPVAPGTPDFGGAAATAPAAPTDAGISGAPSPTTPAATTAATPPPNFTDVINNQFGAGNPFTGAPTTNMSDIAGGMATTGAFKPLDWFGKDPIQTAWDKAQLMLDKNLAAQGAGFAGAGMGNSSRAALTRGTAMGEAATGLGDILAQRGLESRQSDLDRILSAATTQGGFNQQDVGRALSAFLGAGQLGQGQQALDQGDVTNALAGLQGLTGVGTGVTGTAAAEQTPPGLEWLNQLLANLGIQTTDATGRGRSTTGTFA